MDGIKEVDVIGIIPDHQPRASFLCLQPVTNEPEHVDIRIISHWQL
jgi:hypothetical protein